MDNNSHTTPDTGRCTILRTTHVAAAVVTAALLAVGAPVGTAAADSTTVPGVLTTSSMPSIPGTADGTDGTGAFTATTLTTSTTPLAVPIPPGVVPSAITGVLTMTSAPVGASVVVLLNDREAARVPATPYAKVLVPVLTTDVLADSTVALTLRYDAGAAPVPGAVTDVVPEAADCTGGQATPGITLRKLGVDYTGAEPPPTSAATFFPTAASRIDIRVDADADDDVLAAALDAVAAIRYRYPGDTTVTLLASDQPLPVAGAGQRVVDIVGGGGADVTTALGSVDGIPSLTLTGSGLLLADAARALSGPAFALTDDTDSSGPGGAAVVRTRATTRTIADVLDDTAPSLTVSAPAPAGTVQVGLHQDGFGGPVATYRVHLAGAHSTVPAGIGARVDVFLDDRLVGSRDLDPQPGGRDANDGAFDLDLDIPGDDLRSTSVLRVTLTTDGGPASLCAPELNPVLNLNPDLSTVTATLGTGGRRGFQLFPQAYDGRLDVAIRATGSARLDAAIDAAALVSALQRDAATPLEVSVVDPAELVGGPGVGILLGADAEDSRALATPLAISGDRSLDLADTGLRVSSSEPFAALQAVEREGRFLLVLGSWQPGDQQAKPELAHRLTERVDLDGWDRLDGDVIIADSSGPAYAADSGLPATEAAAPVDSAPSYLRRIEIGLSILLVFLLILLVRGMRRQLR